MADIAKKKAEDPSTVVSSKALVNQGNRLGSKTSATLTAKALRGAAKQALSGAGRLLFSTPAVIAQDILISESVGQDQFGRAIDTPEGFQKAERDREVADYFMQYGAFPEESSGTNQQAVENMIENKMKQQRMAQILRAEKGNQEITPEQQQIMNKKNQFMDNKHQGGWSGGGYSADSFIGRGGG